MILITENPETTRQIKESWANLKDYINDKAYKRKDLYSMCSRCSDFTGKSHCYNDCLDKPCFRFYLAYEYLEWANSY